MGDHKDGQPGLVPQLQQQGVHVLADARVQRAEGLVEQQYAGFHDQRLGDGQALLHAAGQRAGVLVQGMTEADLAQNGFGLRAGVALGGTEQPAEQWRAWQLQTDGDVRAAREASEKALKRRKAARDSKPPPAEIRPAPVDPEGEGAANED